MIRTQPHVVRLAEEIQKEFHYIPWRIALAIARHHNQAIRPINGCNKARSHREYIACLVAAYIRHTNTEYDALYGLGFDKRGARAAVQPAIRHNMQAWR
jgi:hypothetical protein